MMAYTPPTRFDTLMELRIPEIKVANGITKKTYPNDKEHRFLIFGSFRTFGGTEITVNDVIAVVDTATIDTWYHPKINTNCQIAINNATYELIGTPEDIDNRHQYMQFKVQATKGGA